MKGQEFLSHLQRRDRAIEESVDAGLKETQGGWSFMHGHSTAAAYDAKAYGQYTGNLATGFGTSHSWGNREVEADSRQDLHDQVVQGTTYVRALTSTVIVQASQAEQSKVQTRRVANHNHCHALTIQYYEVLRHFRIHTEFVRRRKAIAIPFAPFSFDADSALRFRTLLEQALLDEGLLPYFDALVRLGLDLYPKEPADPDVSTGPTYFTGTLGTLEKPLEVDSQRFPLYPTHQGARVKIEKGSTVHITAEAQEGGIKFPIEHLPTATYDVEGQTGDDAPPDQGWRMAGARSFALLAKIGPDFYEVGRDGTVETMNEGELSLWFNDKTGRPQNANSGKANAWVTVSAPPASGAPGQDQDKVPLRIGDPKDVDTIKQGFLIKHLNANIGYYNRAVWFLMDPVERRLYLERALGADNELLSAIDDRPIAVSGSRVAFAYDGPVPDDGGEAADDSHEALESIVTLPTRGLFAEAQLGHCNSCEKRDVTRMWDWREMTAEEPPAIAGIEPGPKGQTPTVTPSQLPSNVIQIVPSPSAPDPVGLAAALKLLGTPNIFRDMSGLDEVSTILGKLVDGSTATLAEMVKGAAAAKQKVDAERAKGASTNGTTSDNGASQEQTPGERYDNLQVAKEMALASEQLGLSDQQTSDLAEKILGGGGGSGGGSEGPTIQLVKAGQLAAAAGEAALDIGMTIVQKVKEDFINEPDVKMGAVEDGFVHLLGYPDPGDYSGPPSGSILDDLTMYVRLENLGGGSVLDGLYATYKIEWDDGYTLDPAVLKTEHKDKKPYLPYIQCKHRIRVTPVSPRAGKAVSKADVQVKVLAAKQPIPPGYQPAWMSGVMPGAPGVSAEFYAVLRMTIALTSTLIGGTSPPTETIEIPIGTGVRPPTSHAQRCQRA